MLLYNFLLSFERKKQMSRRNNRTSSGSAGLIGLLGVAIGAGLGFLASKIFESESQPSREQRREPVPVMPVKQEKNQITKTDINNYDDLEELMICPITHEIMTEPCVLTTCGHSFQKKFIIDWVEKKESCPLCVKSANASDIQINYQLKQLIHYHQKNKNGSKVQTQKKAKE